MDTNLDVQTVLCLNGKEHVFGEAKNGELAIIFEYEEKIIPYQELTFDIKLFQRFGYYKQSEFVVLCEYVVMCATINGHTSLHIKNAHMDTLFKSSGIGGTISIYSDQISFRVNDICGLFAKQDLISFMSDQIFDLKSQPVPNCCYYLNKKRTFTKFSGITKCVNETLTIEIGITDIIGLITSYFVIDATNYFVLRLLEQNECLRDRNDKSTVHNYIKARNKLSTDFNVEIEQIFERVLLD